MFGCVFREENLAKIARRVKDYKVEEMNAPREGKRLLVLDVDYTLFGKNIKNVFMCAQDYVHRRRTPPVVVVKTTRRLASTAPSLFVGCWTLRIDVCTLCVFRSQVVCRNGSGADETIPPRVSDISLRGLRHCHLVYVALFFCFTSTKYLLFHNHVLFFSDSGIFWNKHLTHVLSLLSCYKYEVD